MARVKSGRAMPLSLQEEVAIIDAYLSGEFIKNICRRLRHAQLTVYRILDSRGLRGGVPIDEAGLDP